MYRDALLRFTREEAYKICAKINEMIDNKEYSGTVEITPFIVSPMVYEANVEESINKLLNGNGAERFLDMSTIDGILSDCVTYVQYVMEDLSEMAFCGLTLGSPYFKKKFITHQKNPKLPDKWCNLVFAFDFTYEYDDEIDGVPFES